jgi:DNA polymerase
LVTIHPSFLLRIQDAADKKREYAGFVADLRLAAKILAKEMARAATRDVA